MFERTYSEELRGRLTSRTSRHGGRRPDRDVARLMAPWRRHDSNPDTRPREL
jgi:hypothetical protein